MTLVQGKISCKILNGMPRHLVLTCRFFQLAPPQVYLLGNFESWQTLFHGNGTFQWPRPAATPHHKDCTGNGPRNMTKSWRRWPGLQIPLIPNRLSIHGMCRSNSNSWSPHLTTYRTERICCQNCDARHHRTLPKSPVSTPWWHSAKDNPWWGLHESDFLWDVPNVMDKILGVLRPGRCLQLFVTFLKLFWNSFCGVVHCDDGKSTAVWDCCCHEGVYLVCTNIWWVVRVKLQGFQTEHCIVTRWSVLFSSSVSGFNQCIVRGDQIHTVTLSKITDFSELEHCWKHLGLICYAGLVVF